MIEMIKQLADAIETRDVEEGNGMPLFGSCNEWA